MDERLLIRMQIQHPVLKRQVLERPLLLGDVF